MRIFTSSAEAAFPDAAFCEDGQTEKAFSNQQSAGDPSAAENKSVCLK